MTDSVNGIGSRQVCRFWECKVGIPKEKPAVLANFIPIAERGVAIHLDGCQILRCSVTGKCARDLKRYSGHDLTLRAATAAFHP